MATFRDRFPSRRELSLLAAACVFPVHIWAIVNLLWELPAWIIRAAAWDVLGMVAYTLVTSFMESAALLLILLAVAVLLPSRWFRDRIVAQGTLIVLAASVWAIGVHYHIAARLVPPASHLGAVLWLAVCLAFLAITSILVYRVERSRRLLEAAVERLAVLSYLYISLDILGAGVLIIRNL